MVLATGIYTKPINMWGNKPASRKKWSEFNKFFAEEYHNLRKLKHDNVTKAGFCGANISITIKDEISEALDNLAMVKTA